ncbi:hypothetical protein [Saccharopolyspora erythraea]|uniref:hypothetical protein n=1 Tax=Saccharopolyspora erythraea TaxID=1836 RepID=UPI0020121F7A|nr:hypothetical protein [Saccharopolyspora erythraea]
MFQAAYVEESYDLALGVYVLTAGIVDLADAEHIRSALRALRPSSGKLHWYESDHSHRLHLAKAVGVLPVGHITVIGRGKQLRAERARRKCMETLLPELDRSAVGPVVFESRQLRNNKQDQELVAVCRRKRLLSGRIQVSFVPGGSEPLLWVADVACGAALADQRGEPACVAQFGAAMSTISISIA